MQEHERNYYVANIIAGQYRYKIGGQHFIIKSPSLIQQADAENIFRESYERASLAGAYSDDELREFLAGSNIYTEKDEADRIQIEKNIEDQKVGLYEYSVRASARESIRKALDIARKELNRLLILKHSHDHLSSIGIAQITKSRYLVGCSVYYDNERPYWPDSQTGWLSPDCFLDQIILNMRKNEINEKQIRELARTNPWRSIWESAKYCGNRIFESTASLLTSDQRNIIAWSSVYEAVRDPHNYLSEEIISDDDMLDGWMINQRRQREKNLDRKMGEELIKNDKIKNSDEIFIVSDKQDIGKVLNMNSDQSRMTLNTRLETVKKYGEVPEAKMPDTIVRNQQNLMNEFAKSVKGNQK